MQAKLDYLDKHDIGTAHPMLDSVRRAYRFMRDFQHKSRDEILDHQFKSLKQLVHHASKTVPMYTSLYKGTVDIHTWEDFESLPELTRIHLNEWQIDQRVSTKLSADTVPRTEIKTSGTTSIPVATGRSTRAEVWRSACKLLEYEWMELNPKGATISVRFNLSPESPNWNEELGCVVTQNWEEGLVSKLIDFGQGYQLPLGLSGRNMAEFINLLRARHLMCTTTIMETAVPFLDCSQLDLVISLGETMPPATREKVSKAYGARVYDIYGAREIGRIASECPDNGGHHVHDSNIYLEIVNDHGKSVMPGESGNVLITTLQNPGMPLIRYRLGDIATVGSPCSCGRGLMHIETILGREVSRIYLPGGRKEHGRRALRYLEELSSVNVFRLRQGDYTAFTLELTPELSITQDEVNGLWTILNEITESEVSLDVITVPEIPITAGGKRHRLVHDFEPA